MNIYEDTYLADILHDIAQGLLGPTMVLIILLILVSLFFFGQIIVEYFTERRHFKQKTAYEIISPNVPSQIVRSMNLNGPAAPFCVPA